MTIQKITGAVYAIPKNKFMSKLPGGKMYHYSLIENTPAARAGRNIITRLMSFLEKMGIDLKSGGGVHTLKNGNVVNFFGFGKNLNINMTKPDGRPILNLSKFGNITQLETKGSNFTFNSSTMTKMIK